MKDEANPKPTTQSNKAKTMIEVGAEMVGAVSGNVLGFLFAGPSGLILGGAGGVLVGKALAAVGEDIANRILSTREKVRVGAALAVSATRTLERLSNGDKPRTDNFMNDGSDRPPVKEVTEGFLIAAQRAFDEKKVPFIGRLSANLNFRADLDEKAAGVLVRLADRISYTQLCLLRLALLNTHGNGFTGGRIENKRTRSPSHAALLSEMKALSDDGLINIGNSPVWSILDIDPPHARLQSFGVHLYDLMELGLIPETDIAPIRAVLHS